MTDLKAENLHLKFELENLRKDFNSLLKLNKQIIAENKALRKENTQLKEEIIKLKLEIEKLKVKPNEPSGSKPDYLKSNKNTNNKKNKKSGQKKGHKGFSRKTPDKIDVEKHYYATDKCPNCGSIDLKATKIRKKIITDLMFELIHIKEYLHDKICKKCSNVIRAISPNGDSQSPYGRNLKSLFVYLRTQCGATLRPLETLFTEYFGAPITDSSISNNEIAISKLTKIKYESYLEDVKKSKFSYKDETSYRIGGKIYWIWVYDDNETVFYRLSDNRGKSTLINDFGEKPKQISINDCYAAYNIFKNRGICWSHILRECKTHSEKEDASRNEVIFYNKIRDLWYRAEKYVEKKEPLEKRKKKRKEFESELINIMIGIKKRTEFLKRMFNRLDKHLEHTFLFVENLDISSTNNLAERDLRPFVIHRKASFGSKSEEGGEARVMFKTIFENAKRKGKLLSQTLNFIFENSKANLLPNP